MVLALPDGTRRTLTPRRAPRRVLGHVRRHGPDRHGRRGHHRPAPHRDQPAVGSTPTGCPTSTRCWRCCPRAAARYRYSVAWVDLLAHGPLARPRRSSPRATSPLLDDLPARRVRGRTPLSLLPAPHRHGPDGGAQRGSRPASIRAFNELWYRKAPRRRRDELQSIDKFFYPLDMVAGWNRMYGPRGFLQWQCLVPFGDEDVLREIVEALSAHRAPSCGVGAQVLRRRRPGAAVVPRSRVDAGARRPHRGRRACCPCSTGSTSGCSTSAGGSTWPRTAACGPSWCRPCTRASTSGGPVRDRMDPDRRWSATSPAASTCSADTPTRPPSGRGPVRGLSPPSGGRPGGRGSRGSAAAGAARRGAARRCRAPSWRAGARAGAGRGRRS